MLTAVVKCDECGREQCARTTLEPTSSAESLHLPAFLRGLESLGWAIEATGRAVCGLCRWAAWMRRAAV